MLNAEKLMRLAEDQNFSEIIKLCTEEIISAKAKKSGDASFEKSRKAFAKYLKQLKNHTIAAFRYYSMQEILNYGMCQCVTNNCTAVCVFGEKFSGEFIEKIPAELTPVGLNQLFPKDFKSYPISIEISQKDINAAYKLIAPNDHKQRVITFTSGSVFDLNFAKPVFDILGDCTVYISGKTTVPAMVVSDAGVGLICPVRVPVEKMAHVKSITTLLNK